MHEGPNLAHEGVSLPLVKSQGQLQARPRRNATRNGEALKPAKDLSVGWPRAKQAQLGAPRTALSLVKPGGRQPR